MSFTIWGIKQANARIKELERENAAEVEKAVKAEAMLDSERESSTSAISALKEENAALKVANEELASVAKEENEKLTSQVADLKASQAEFDKRVESAAAAKAVEQIAKTGANPVKAEKASGSSGKTMSREEFTKLKPSDQQSFCLKGGVII